VAEKTHEAIGFSISPRWKYRRLRRASPAAGSAFGAFMSKWVSQAALLLLFLLALISPFFLTSCFFFINPALAKPNTRFYLIKPNARCY